MDSFSRRIVGWNVLEEMGERLVPGTLREAIRGRQPGTGLIHNGDRGGQSAGGQFRGVLRRAGMRQSMSRAENCYDNAFLESCFGTIKTELEMAEYDNGFVARRELSEVFVYRGLAGRRSPVG